MCWLRQQARTDCSQRPHQPQQAHGVCSLSIACCICRCASSASCGKERRAVHFAFFLVVRIRPWNWCSSSEWCSRQQAYWSAFTCPSLPLISRRRRKFGFMRSSVQSWSCSERRPRFLRFGRLKWKSISSRAVTETRFAPCCADAPIAPSRHSPSTQFHVLRQSCSRAWPYLLRTARRRARYEETAPVPCPRNLRPAVSVCTDRLRNMRRCPAIARSSGPRKRIVSSNC